MTCQSKPLHTPTSYYLRQYKGREPNKRDWYNGKQIQGNTEITTKKSIKLMLVIETWHNVTNKKTTHAGNLNSFRERWRSNLIQSNCIKGDKQCPLQYPIKRWKVRQKHRLHMISHLICSNHKGLFIFYVSTTCNQQHTSSFLKHHSSFRHFTIINFRSECDMMAVWSQTKKYVSTPPGRCQPSLEAL